MSDAKRQSVVSQEFAMPPDYLQILNEASRLHLVIVGRDPFPIGANGIPFCKDTWNEQRSKSSSGNNIMNSLFDDTWQANRRESPREHFLELAREGIGFLNMSYHFLGERITKRALEKYVAPAWRINQPILCKSDRIVLCGQAKCLRKLFSNFPKSTDLHEAVHPDQRNCHSRYGHVRDNWEKYWSKGKLGIVLATKL